MATVDSTPTTGLEAAVGALDDPLVEGFGMLLESHAEMVNAVSSGLQNAIQLPLPWVGVLIRLARTPGHRLRMSELARDMTMSNSGLTRLVDRVEAAGHVRREACSEDRRGLHAVLTEEGMAIVASSTPRHLADLQATLGTALEPHEVTTLTDLLRRVRDRARAVQA